MILFLSHSIKDKPDALRLAGRLKSHGVEVWLDEEKTEVSNWISEQTQQAFREADFLCIWITNEAIQSGWIEKQWVPRFKQEHKENRAVVIPLLVDSCKLLPFLEDLRYADFRISFSHGLNDLLQAIGIKTEREPQRFITNYVNELLADLTSAVIPLPHLTTINLLESLKRIPRSGKKIRLDTYSPRVEIRSIYDHIISIAHTADCLITEFYYELSYKDSISLARCIVYHDMCEIFLGDIPNFTQLSDIKRSRASILGEVKLSRFSQEDRDLTANNFIKLFLDEREQVSMNSYQNLIEEKNDLTKLFHFLDQVNPIIGVWRYLHYYRGSLGDAKRFVSTLKDFFIYERPTEVAKDFTRDLLILNMHATLRDPKAAIAYYERNPIQKRLTRLGAIPQIIEGHKMHFATNDREKHDIPEPGNLAKTALNLRATR